MLRFSQIVAAITSSIRLVTRDVQIDLPVGMYVPESDPRSIDDVDLMGFVIPDARFVGKHVYDSVAGCAKAQLDKMELTILPGCATIWQSRLN